MRTLITILSITILASCSQSPATHNTSDKETPIDNLLIEQSIFFHEDDYCQVQLTLHENLSYLHKEAEEVLGFASEHFDGSGFTDIKVREEETYKLADREIKTKDIEKTIVNFGFDKIPKVFTGYGQSYKEQLKNTNAYGKNGCAIFYDYKDSVVEHIWLEYDWENEQTDKDKFAICISELGKKWSLLLMDWNQLKLVELKDSIATRKYLNER